MNHTHEFPGQLASSFGISETSEELSRITKSVIDEIIVTEYLT